MSYYDAVIAILTILVSLALVILLVGAAWWLMWKVGKFWEIVSLYYCIKT